MGGGGGEPNISVKGMGEGVIDRKSLPYLLEHLLDCLIDAHGAGGLNGRGARHISFNIRHVGILDCAKNCKYSIAN